MHIAFLLFLAAAAPDAPRIESEPIDANRFRLSISGGRIGSVAAAQAALLATARRLCGKRAATFGAFRFREPEEDAAEAAAGRRLEQELWCGSAQLPPLSGATPAPDWQPSEAHQQAVLAASYDYFAAKDAARHAQAWARLADSMKTVSPLAHWREDAAEFNTRAGPVLARRVTEISWYNNPPDAPQPGLYVAADFSAEFEKMEFVCGYLMWRLDPDGRFRLVREEQNLVERRASGKKIASLDRAPLRAQMGCKD